MPTLASEEADMEVLLVAMEVDTEEAMEVGVALEVDLLLEVVSEVALQAVEVDIQALMDTALLHIQLPIYHHLSQVSRSLSRICPGLHQMKTW
jgi:hypothetical protein